MNNPVKTPGRRGGKWQTYEVAFVLTTDFNGTLSVKARTPEEAKNLVCVAALEVDYAEMECFGNEVLIQAVRQVDGGCHE